MNDDLAIGRTTGTGAPGAEDAASRTADQARTLAQEFEALLLLQVIRSLRQSMVDAGESDEPDGLGGATFTDTIDVELSRHLSRSGGFGLADVLARGLEAQLGLGPAPSGLLDLALLPPAGAPVTRTGPALDGPGSRVGPGAPGGRLPDDDRTEPFDGRAINSPFGWRSDPIDGRRRFHGGVDFRAAYGEPVRAAAGGRVVQAGYQGSYGLTVVVEHVGGVATRYAHLSSIDVAVADGVQAGATLGRAGRSGRATGDHLHFEVMVNGRRVDPQGFRLPAEATESGAPIDKGAVRPADYPTEGSVGWGADDRGGHHED